MKDPEAVLIVISEIRALPQRGSTEHGLYFLYALAAQDAVFFRVGV